MHENHNTRSARAISAAVLLFLASLAHADVSRRHVQLLMPQPFAWDQYGPTNPLATDGSDYPCKVRQGDAFRVVDATEMVIGEDQEVSFAGWAVHGGGSCQFALAEGRAPTRDTAWKVIHSIEGGCPKANVSGNLPEGQDPDTYAFRVPDDFAPGNYTFAWTWVNRIAAEPEFYMNCAPITVKAAATTTTEGTLTKKNKVEERRRRRRYDQAQQHPGRRGTTKYYPDLFLANIGDASNGCTTAEALEEQVAIQFPYPGDSVTHPNGPENLYKQPCDGNTRNAGSTAGGGSSQPSTTTSGRASSSAATSRAGSATTTSSSSTVVVSSTPVGTAATIVSSQGTLSKPSHVASTSTYSAAASTGTSTLDSPCTDGHLLCVDGTQFSTCTGGTWDTPQDLAQNATCVEEGESIGLDTTYHWD